MTISNNLDTFWGNSVEDWEKGAKITIPEKVAYRIRSQHYDAPKDEWTQLFQNFLKDPKINQITSLVIGHWPTSYEKSSVAIVDELIAAVDKLTSLKAIFLGDITYEECEISWIVQSDVSRLLSAYPNLEYLAVRGGTQLKFSPVKHQNLKTLIVQTGGLPKEVIQGICNSDLPALEHLELWLGVDDYGGDSTIDDLMPILSLSLFPTLTNLGLCNSKFQNAIAKAVVDSPVLANLKVLNLSMGTLTDKGATYLLNSSAVKKLERLDLRHHFCSKEMVKTLQSLGNVIIDDPQEIYNDDEEYSRYVSVSE